MTVSDSQSTPVIELRHVDKHYGDLHVLKDINLSVHKGEVLVVIGPSGSGKSTMCRTINRLETRSSSRASVCPRRAPSSRACVRSWAWCSRASTSLRT